MATLASKQHLVASLNVMLAAKRDGNKPPFTQDEIIEILSAMAETDAMASNPQLNESVHWQNGPSRAV